MKKILSEIYHETFTVKSRSDHMKEEYIQAVDRLNEMEEQLCRVLPEEAVELFEQYKIASSDLAEITGEQDFISGYQLGVKMIMAGIGRSEEEKSE